MKIEFFVKRDFLTADPFSGVEAVKPELLSQNAVVVTENNEYIGTLTATDILRKPHNLVIDCVIDKQKIQAKTSVFTALKKMKSLETDVLPVYKNEKFIGLIYKNDLVDYLTEYNQELNKQLEAKTAQLNEFNNNLEILVEKKTTELNELLATKDKFFSIISHDLRSPFNSLIGFSELLLTRFDRFDKQRVQGIAKSIHKVAVDTYKLLENLLEWAKVQQNGVNFKPEDINLTDFIEEKYLTFKQHAEKKRITIIHEIEKKNTMVKADANMLDSIIRNLLFNSIKFTPEGGKIFIGCKASGERISVSIQDTGIGMSEQQKEDILNAGLTQSRKGTDGERGVGLGLLLVKEFLKYHNSKIEIESQKNTGSSFVFMLPRSGNFR